jgi:hypothetical protein
MSLLVAVLLAGCSAPRLAEEEKAARAHVALAHEAGARPDALALCLRAIAEARRAADAATADLARANDAREAAEDAQAEAKEQRADVEKELRGIDDLLTRAQADLAARAAAPRAPAPHPAAAAVVPAAPSEAAAASGLPPSPLDLLERRVDTLRAMRWTAQQWLELVERERRAAEADLGAAVNRAAAAEQRIAAARALLKLAEDGARAAEVEALREKRAAIDARIAGAAPAAGGP